ncbi:hypothetical protein F4781DRAFT_382793 [Annulohypoxylon bovei var. microspora]|nr:hypothetical protein F4781DRAFT_382793 [Annulohypoxylon bovei var. microspora]
MADTLVVCAVLDCCFAGGADRIHNNEECETAVRCRKKTVANQELLDSSSRGRSSRDAVPWKSWFYRSRGYNLIAASQPHGKAQEFEEEVEKVHYGRMTYHLVKALNEHRFSTKPVTYGQLQESLEAMCRRSQSSNKKQQPVHLGDPDRVIFSSAGSTPNQAGIIASIIGVDATSVRINKGSASNVGKGDIFQIYRPSDSFFGTLATDASPVATVQVNRVRGLDSVAVLCDKKQRLQGVSIGWFAKLSERANHAKVCIVTPNEYESVIKSDWESHIDPQFPVQLIFTDQPKEDVDVIVEINEQSSFCFQDGKRNPMSYVPPLSTSLSHSSGDLMDILKHLCLYQVIANLKAPTSLPRPKYEFRVEQLPESEDTGSYSSWKIHFENKHHRTLYLTILNLSPVYGVRQIFPSHTQFASSKAVEPGMKIPDLFIDITVPKSLTHEARNPGFHMKDMIKILVSTEQANFYNYQLPDLVRPGVPEDTSDEESDDYFDTDEGDTSDTSEDDWYYDPIEESDSEEYYDASNGLDSNGGGGRDISVKKRDEAVASWSVDQHIINSEYTTHIP